MKKLHLIVLACILLSSTIASSQSVSQEGRKYSTKEFFSNKRDFQPTKYQSDYYVKVRFDQSPNLNHQKSLTASGVKLIKSIGVNEYLVALNKGLKKETLTQLGVTQISIPSTKEKTSVAIQNLEIPTWASKGNDRVSVTVVFNQAIQDTEIQDILEGYDAPIDERENFQGFIQLTELYLDQIEDLASHPLVDFVDFMQEPDKKLNFENRSILKVNRVQRDIAAGLNLRGEDVCIGIGDGGELGEHMDFTNRVTNRADGTYSSFGAHGDHVAGIVSGEGLINPLHRGIAPDAKIITQKTSLITYYLDEYYEQCGMVLTNNSYGTSANCESNGTYNYTSLGLDNQLNAFPDVLHVFAAGNSGGANCEGYPDGFHTVLRFYQSAKNVLTVGNLREDRTINGNSSRGPVLDGRLKPEVVAVGTSVYSTGRDYNYYSSSGTSMAAPAVTGILGLMYEEYRDLNEKANPDGALMKAIIANTAEDLGNPGPDFTHGFGMVNAARAIQTIEDANYFSGTMATGESENNTITVPANTSQLKVMLYWSDQGAELNAPIALVNDLDLSVDSPSGNVLPWVLDHKPNKVDEDANRGIDRLNNIEQVTIDNPTAGTYTINVDAFNIPLGTQKYWVTYEIISEAITMSYPLGGETFEPGKMIMIEWESPKTINSQFKIEWKSTAASSWEIVKSSTEVEDRFYSWTLPKIYSENARVKVTRLSDDAIVSSTDFKIIQSPESFTVDPGCAHTLDISWTPSAEMTEYIVYEVTKTGLKEVAHTTESSVSVGGEYVPGGEYWFTVLGITTAGTKGPRAVAQKGMVVSGIVCPWINDGVAYLPLHVLARVATKDSLSTMNPITVVVANAGSNDISNFTLSYRVNESEKITEEFNHFIASGDSLHVTFDQTADLSAVGSYFIETWMEIPGDTHTDNDYLPSAPYATHLANDPIEIPKSINFENMGGDYTGNFFAVAGMDNLDINTGTLGQVEFKKELDRKVLSLKPLSLWQEGITFSEAVFTFNLKEHDRSVDPVMLGLEYIGHSQVLALGWGTNGNYIQVRGSDQDEWIQLYEFDYKGDWSELNSLDLTAALQSAEQHFTTSFQLKIVQDALFGVSISNIEISTSSRLPVSWAGFDVVGNEDGQVDVNWITATEFENQHFEVQVASSTNGEELKFRTIGMVAGQGTTFDMNHYQFVDKTPNKTGIRYYRVKQVDIDGTTTYTEIRQLRFNESISTLSVYPNPVQDDLFVHYEAGQEEDVTLQLVDMTGRVLFTQPMHFTEGNHDFHFELSDDISAGFYSLQIIYPSQSTRSIRINKVRD